MKRFAVLLFIIIIAVSLTACTNNVLEDSPAEEKEQYIVKAIVPHEKHTFFNRAWFTLLRVRQTDLIEPSMRGKYYYENPVQDQTYIEIVCDVTNIGKKDIPIDELFDVVALNKEGTEYNSIAYTENSAYTEIIKNSVAFSNEAVRVHYVISVPDSLKEYTLAIRYDGISFETAYTAGEQIGMPEAIDPSSSIDTKNVCVYFQSMEFAPEILPTDTSGYYSYYKAQDGNSYFVLKYQLMNRQPDYEISVDENVYVKLKLNNGKSYECENIIEKAEQDGFSTDVKLVGGGSGTIISMVEVPSSLQTSDYVISFNINGTEYIVKNITA